MYSNNKKQKQVDAMIMAAGRGARMRYMTNFIAKPLLKISKLSMLETNINNLYKGGIEKIIINSSYKHLTIEKGLKNIKLKKKIPETILTYEKVMLETGGGLKNAINYFNSSNVLIINGDSILHNKDGYCPVKELRQNFNECKMDVLLLLSKRKNVFGYYGKGDYKKINNSYTPKITSGISSLSLKYVFTGWQIINKRIINDFPEKIFSLKKVYDLAEKNGRLHGIIHQGNFLHIGDLKSYFLVDKFLKTRKISL